MRVLNLKMKTLKYVFQPISSIVWCWYTCITEFYRLLLQLASQWDVLSAIMLSVMKPQRAFLTIDLSAKDAFNRRRPVPCCNLQRLPLVSSSRTMHNRSTLSLVWKKNPSLHLRYERQPMEITKNSCITKSITKATSLEVPSMAFSSPSARKHF